MTEPRSFRPGTLDADGLLIRDPRYLDAIRQGQRGVNDARELRELVLAHPDLAERLTLPPIDCVSAAHWNGFIPPLMTCAEAGRRNDSPRRPALIELCAEAMERDYGPEAAATWKWTLG
jgi:hypothetical protein